MNNSIILTSILTILITTAYITLSSNNNQTNIYNLSSKTPQYNLELSKKYGAYSKIAYCPEDKVKNWNCKDCQTYNTIQDLQIIENKKKDIFAYVFYDTLLQKIVLSWRGSIDSKNYVTDFTYAKIPYTCTLCEVHLGFY